MAKKNTEPLEIITIRVPAFVKRELEARAEQEDRSLSNVCKRIFLSCLLEEEKRKGKGKSKR